MKIEIDDKIVGKVKRCKKEFGCLKNEKHACCAVVGCIKKNVHFIKNSDDQNCSFNVAFGHLFMCTCPIRKEIFNKYGI
jgi:hypothetical protein